MGAIPQSQLLAKRLKAGKARQIKARIFHTCNDLVDADRLLQRLDLSKTTDRGLQEVRLDAITGSMGRAKDFDLHFNPRTRITADRWKRVAEGRSQGRDLPVPFLYQVGDAYYVVDGNHRVSVARARGETHITAHVIAIDPAPLEKSHTCTRIGFQIR